MQLKSGELTLLKGSNGIGKSSLVQILKKGKQHYFNDENVVYVDQTALNPLNDISLDEVIKQWYKKRVEKLELFETTYEKCLHFRETPLKELSGGQNQLAKICLGLYFSGDIFVLDEPFQHLDQANIQYLYESLVQLKKLNKKILMIEHRSDLIQDIVNSSYILVQTSDELRIQSGS
ncbi:MAG: hypothetical protein CME62_11870 [Halobacteriovoraceae bacterium]|nr:hypothetical protein [Halobacteriovoraceae bacterium]